MEAVYDRAGDEPLRHLQLSLESAGSADAGGALATPDIAALRGALGGMVWTHALRRMYFLLERCLAFSEPALLVGETGTGKTTVCQMAAFVRHQRLHIINCNQHTEVSDFLGGFRPNRHRERSLLEFQAALAAINASPLLAALGLPAVGQPAAPTSAHLRGAVLQAQQLAAAAAKQQLPDAPAAAQQQLAELAALVQQLGAAAAALRAPFEWVDGPLVQAMRAGDILLIDELNLAEDAVLERLNSVLEPGRSVTLAEKGGAGADLVVAHPDFRIVATMNPGGDYGKKELSPALSNRFTSIWVAGIEDESELRPIIESRLQSEFGFVSHAFWWLAIVWWLLNQGGRPHAPHAGPELRSEIAPRLLAFWQFFKTQAAHSARQVLSVRDLLAWVHFVNATAPKVGVLASYAHGAHMVVLDGIGLGVGLSTEVGWGGTRFSAPCERCARGQDS